MTPEFSALSRLRTRQSLVEARQMDLARSARFNQALASAQAREYDEA